MSAAERLINLLIPVGALTGVRHPHRTENLARGPLFGHDPEF